MRLGEQRSRCGERRIEGHLDIARDADGQQVRRADDLPELPEHLRGGIEDENKARGGKINLVDRHGGPITGLGGDSDAGGRIDDDAAEI